MNQPHSSRQYLVKVLRLQFLTWNWGINQFYWQNTHRLVHHGLIFQKHHPRTNRCFSLEKGNESQSKPASFCPAKPTAPAMRNWSKASPTSSCSTQTGNWCARSWLNNDLSSLSNGWNQRIHTPAVNPMNLCWNWKGVKVSWNLKFIISTRYQ